LKGTTVTDRIGDWMQTFTGRQFWPMDPRPDDIHIEDIAHALSMQCRYAGHCVRFYSVAEHCVLLSHVVSAPNRFWALMHDASEAYICDVIRPLKPSLTGYSAAEDRVMGAICRRYGMAAEMPREVKDADFRMLVDESQQNMAPCVTAWNLPPTGAGVLLHLWSPEKAEQEFLARFRELQSAE
jgi:hypothetical protein